MYTDGTVVFLLRILISSGNFKFQQVACKMYSKAFNAITDKFLKAKKSDPKKNVKARSYLFVFDEEKKRNRKRLSET